MPRGRMLSRSISTSRRIESMTEWAQLLFDRIVVWADDFGRIEGDPAVVKAEAKPLSPRSFDEFAAAIAEAIRVGAIIGYRDGNGRLFLQVERSDEHQKGLHKRTKSRCPDPAACRRLTADEYLAACQEFASGLLPSHTASGEVRGISPPEEKRRELEEKRTPPVVPLAGDEPHSPPKEKPTRKKTATHMTHEWRPPAELISEMQAECPAVDVERALPEFRDYWIGEGKPKADWNATFRNRIRFIAERANGNGRRHNPPRADGRSTSSTDRGGPSQGGARLGRYTPHRPTGTDE